MHKAKAMELIQEEVLCIMSAYVSNSPQVPTTAVRSPSQSTPTLHAVSSTYIVSDSLSRANEICSTCNFCCATVFGLKTRSHSGIPFPLLLLQWQMQHQRRPCHRKQSFTKRIPVCQSYHNYCKKRNNVYICKQRIVITVTLYIMLYNII